jgi:sugar lactone lactonase YvrE
MKQSGWDMQHSDIGTQHSRMRGVARTTRALTTRRGASRLGLVAAVAVVGVASLYPVMASAKVNTIASPSLLYSIGGSDHAYVYPSGDDIAPSGAPNAGDLVVSDIGNNQVEEFNISTTPATLVWRVGSYGAGMNQFNNPRDVAVDHAGDVFVADAQNSRIDKLNPDGSWAMSFSKGSNGTNIDVPLGVSVAFSTAMNEDLVYVADTGHKMIRVFDTNGVALATYPSNGACTIGGLRDVDADAAGNIYVANYTNNDVLKFSAGGTCITKWGTTGTGKGQFRALYGVTLANDPVTGAQEVYVADAENNRVQEFTTTGTWIATAGVAGTTDQPGTLTYTRRVAVDASGNLWIADLWDWRVEEWSRTSTGYSYVTNHDIGSPLPTETSTALYNEVNQVAFETSNGTVTSIDAMNTVGQQLTRFAPGSGGALLSTCGNRAESSAIPGYNWPRGVAVDPATGNLWTLDTKQYRVEILTPACKGIVAFGTHGTATNQFNWPYAIAIRGSDEVAWIADTWNNRIVSYNVTTRQPIAATAVKSFLKPGGIAIDPANGNILVADSGNNRIEELSDTHGANPTKVQYFYGGLNNPMGVAADAAGNIYVADTGNNRIVVFGPGAGLGTPTPVIATITGGFNFPQQVAVDAQGNIYVSDTYNDRIQVYGPLS